MEMKSKLMVVIGVILTIVILFTLIGGLAPTMRDSADAMTDSNNCSDGTDANGNTLVYNFTDKMCYTPNASASSLGLAKQYDLPLSGLFSRSGLVFTLVMVMLFVGIVAFILKRRNQ